MTTTPTWEALFFALESDEQALAMRAFWQELTRDATQEQPRKALLEALASALKFRPQRVQRLPEEKLVAYLRSHCREVFYPADWALLFRCFYRDRRAAMMAAFLDHLEIPHDGGGIMHAEAEPVPADRLAAAAQALTGRFDPAAVRHYLHVLDRMAQPTWAHIAEALAQLPGEPAAAATPAAADDDQDAPLVLDLFTTLDRVLIDQVVATVSREEGALTPDELEDLVETVVALNGKRRRSVFHLGFMHGLLADRPAELDRPELDAHRRGWYLTGLLAAKTRQGDGDAIRRLLTEHARAFQTAAEESKGAGPVMANLVLDTLFELGRCNEVLTLLKGQLTPGAFKLARRAYQHATELWRQQQPDAALPVLRLLRERLPRMDEQPERVEALLTQVERRHGQCLQSNGDLDGARVIFEGILDRVQDGSRPELRADLGLLAGGFRSMERLRLPEDQAARDSMRGALERGEVHFQAAVDAAGTRAVNACYALAVKEYLCWADQASDDPAVHRAALKHVEMALAGMRQSPSAGAYERLGLLGQALFIEIVLSTDSLVVGESHRALALWERIPSDAGIFPKQDVQRLLTTVELLNPTVAARIAESVWRKRAGGDAWEVLGRSAERLVAHSDYLKAELLGAAREETTPRARRFGIWKLLVPALLREGASAQAAEGLDALEALSEEPGLAAQLLEWLREPGHYDPVWTESDADWARVRLARAIGRDEDCVHPLIALFHRLRDERPTEAAQTAQLLVDWRLAREQGQALLGSLPDELTAARAAGAEQRLRAGERVRVLFVGGNETQARYDASIREELLALWPGLTLRFEHTGWSSNWGREVDRLVRLANQCDAVVIMRMMRTILGRTLRERSESPWVACTGTGRRAMLQSIREAALVGIEQRQA